MTDGAAKKAWRQRLRARRAALTDDERRQAEARMTAHFWRLPEASSFERVLAYASVPPEAPTTKLVQTLQRAGATVFLPRLDKDRPGEMEVAAVGPGDELVPGPYFGILQPPEDAPAIDPATLDAVVAPGVGFDRKGRRLGQAGGYYDRLFAALPAKVLRVGWAFGAQLVDELPEEPHDEGVDVLVTEAGIHRFVRKAKRDGGA